MEAFIAGLQGLGLWPIAAAFAAGIGIAHATTTYAPQHAKKVAAGAWVIGGAAIGTAIAPGIGTVIGAGVGALVAWATW